MKDLVLLVPDKHICETVCTILDYRRQALHIRELNFKPITHHGRDGGVRKNAHQLLRLHIEHYANAVVIFDLHGCGEEGQKTAHEIEDGVMANLTDSGWSNDNALVVVIDPELEAWVWGDSPHLAPILGEENLSTEEIKGYLRQEGFVFDGGKPTDPKGAMEYILRKSRIPRSSSIFKKLARKVSLERCEDESFLKLRDFLRRKFPQENHGERK